MLDAYGLRRNGLRIVPRNISILAKTKNVDLK